MATLTRFKIGLLGTCILGLSGCGLASLPPGYTPAEQQVVDQMAGANFIPRTEEERAAILTQDLFAQAAFWSREYDLNPADLEAAIGLSSTLRRLGNPTKSIEIAQQTRALYPRDAGLLTELSASLVASNQPKEAIKSIDTALQQDPGIARLWSLKGAALDQLEKFAEARQHYTRALNITPNSPTIMSNVGLSYALEGDPATAEVWLRRAAAQPGASASTRQNLALILGLQGKANEAEQWVNKDLDDKAAKNNIKYLSGLRGGSTASTSAPTSKTPRKIIRQAPPNPYTKPVQAHYTKTQKPQAMNTPRTLPITPKQAPQRRAQNSDAVLNQIAQSNQPKRQIAAQQQQNLVGRAQANAAAQARYTEQQRRAYFAQQQQWQQQRQQQRAPYRPPHNNQPANPYYAPPQGYQQQQPIQRQPARTRRN